MNKIFCLMGKSSSGKDTIYQQISKDFIDLKNIVLYTTRPIRKGEIDGITYHYVTENIYQDMVEKNLVIEARSYQTIHGVWTYFTSSANIDLENNSYITINTLDGYQKLVQYFGKECIVPIYIELESGERLQRALNRELKNENPKILEICRRFLTDQEDFCEERLSLCKIQERFYNDDLLECVEKIEEKIRQELYKSKQYHL